MNPNRVGFGYVYLNAATSTAPESIIVQEKYNGQEFKLESNKVTKIGHRSFYSLREFRHIRQPQWIYWFSQCKL